jgi:formylglycine-generating enzyme required for sulfatase activity
MKVRMPNVVPETPAWAETFGVDRYGLFAGVTVGKSSQMLRWIEPGSFRMGSPEGELGRWEDEGPQHDVTIPDGFWMGQTPVTQASYEAVIGSNPSEFQGDGRRPVENVRWDEAVDFCHRLNERLYEPGNLTVRLPSEAEWEYACRAGTTGALYDDKELTGENRCSNLDKLAWYSANSDSTTHPVGQNDPNRWGLYDMLGNVWEWCEDAWHGNYQGAPNDGSAWGREGGRRVFRGGGWAARARYCRCAYRDYWVPGGRSHFLGFRLVLAARDNGGVRSFS